MVGADGGQVCEQADEAVHRVGVVGAFAGRALVSVWLERAAAATGSLRLARTAGLSLS